MGEAHEVVGGLAHRRDDDHDVVARRGGCARRDRRRPGCGRGRRPRCRRTSGREATAVKATGDARCAPDGFPPGTFCACAQRRQASRKKENARAAREAREAALKKRQKRTRDDPQRRRSSVAIFVGVIVLLNVTRRRRQEERRHDDHDAGQPRPPSPKPRQPTYSSTPAKTYTATITTNFGDHRARARHEGRADRRRTLRVPRQDGFYDGSRGTGSSKDFVIQGGAPERRRRASGPGYTRRRRAPEGRATRSATVAAAKTGNDPNGTFDSQFFIVTGSRKGASLAATTTPRFGTVTSGMDVVKKIEALPDRRATDAPTQQGRRSTR